MKQIIFIIMLLMVFLTLGCNDNKGNTEQNPVPQADQVTPTGEPANPAAYTPGEWIENYEAAINFAKQSNKVILANFTGSDWCIWCKRLMSEVFTQPEFIEYAKQNLILLTLDFPSKVKQTEELKKQNSALQNKFGIQGYPTIVLIDASGKEINRTGYQPGGAVKYVAHLQDLMPQPK